MGGDGWCGNIHGKWVMSAGKWVVWQRKQQMGGVATKTANGWCGNIHGKWENGHTQVNCASDKDTGRPPHPSESRTRRALRRLVVKRASSVGVWGLGGQDTRTTR